MADVRELTFGLDFDLDEPIKQLDAVVDRLEQVTSGEEDAADASHEVGAQLSSGMDAAEASTRRAEKAVEGIGTQLSAGADAAEDFGRAGEKIGSQFRDMGREADSFGSAVKKSMGASLKSGKNFWSSIKAGAQGGFGYAEKRLSDWHKKFQTGAKSMVTALSHPIQTIKNKLGDALLSSEKKTEGLGAKAVATAKKLLGMGQDGENAGDSIKEAMKGAVGSLIGFEAIEGVISKLNELGAAALEVAKAAETTEKKFNAAFSGTDAADWVDNFADAVHRSTAEVQSFMVSNKSMYGEMGITGQVAADLSKITTSLSYDLGNAFSMDDAEALGVIQDYIKGNNAALEEYGVHIDDATLKASAMQMGLGANVDSLNDAAKAQVRLNALLGQSEKIQQAAINDTDGLTNAQKSLNGIMQNFALEAGEEFTPVLEGLYGTIIENWPTIEPMLMGLVETLSSGLSEAMPVLLDLGQTLIPTLTDVVGTLFEAATPILSVVEELASQILPPLVGFIGEIAQTLLPPVVGLLETISPLLDSISPVLSVIGDILQVIAQGLGSAIGWMSDGVGKVTSFFSGIFGGAKDSKSAVDDLSGAVNGLGTATSKKTSLAVDTSKYKEKVTGAATASTKAVKDSSKQAQTSAESSFSAMGTSATSTYSRMESASKASWKSMTLEATTGANKIISELGRVKTAAAGTTTSRTTGSSSASSAGAKTTPAASASTAGKVGTSIPHHAGGTPNFEGGPTWMNEQGGELAVLPGGSAIIPADQTERLMQSYTNFVTNSNTNNNTSNTSRTSVVINPSFTIKIEGNAGDERTMSALEDRLRSIFRDLYQEAQEEDYTARALQAGYA
jgi:phage-related protein